ncbi:MAG: putative toxin-antitoxin system toxin component, PIN family [Gemmataceae bacterium]
MPVVFDTNVFVRSFLTKSKESPNRQVVRLWLLEKKLQLVVGSALVDEYLEVFGEVLGFSEDIIRRWHRRFADDSRVTMVAEPKALVLSRDPDDNAFLAVARAGRAEYVVTNDRDLLDIAELEKRRLSFEIVTPVTFLDILET